MRFLLYLFLLLILTGCCRLADIPDTSKPVPTEPDNALYQFRLERSGATKLSGLLALKHQGEGVWGGLLDATGVPLVKILVQPDGTHALEYCAAAVCDTKLPEVVGNLVKYLYFSPANQTCPWYTVSCICEDSESDHKIKWKKFGPFRSWGVEKKNLKGRDESIDVQMYFSTVKIHLKRIGN